MAQLQVPAGQRGPAIPGMSGGVHISVPFVAATLAEIERLEAKAEALIEQLASES